jgi:hypothetical protein
MKQTGHLENGKEIEHAEVIELLLNKFRAIDYSKVKNDIFPFIKEPERVQIWSEDFFASITKEQLKTT